MASFAWSTVTAAQTVYKCGDSYRQIPCAGGVVIDAPDRRSSEQKLQSDLATRRDARTADAMEQERLKQEQLDLAANTPGLKSAQLASTGNSRPSQTQKRKKKSAAGTASGAGGNKKKPARTKRTVNQDRRKP